MNAYSVVYIYLFDYSCLLFYKFIICFARYQRFRYQSKWVAARARLLCTGELSAPHPLNWRQTAAQTVSLVIIVVVLMCFILSTALYYIVYVISCHPLIDFIIAFWFPLLVVSLAPFCCIVLAKTKHYICTRLFCRLPTNYISSVSVLKWRFGFL